MKSCKPTFPTDNAERLDANNKGGDLIWGAAAIAAEIERTPTQVYYLIRIGALDGAIKKLGHRTIAASRRKLRELVTAPP